MSTSPIKVDHVWSVEEQRWEFLFTAEGENPVSFAFYLKPDNPNFGYLMERLVERLFEFERTRR